MILRRLGNKSNIAQEIIKYFPEHKIYIEPFFGAGGMFFNKPKAKQKCKLKEMPYPKHYVEKPNNFEKVEAGGLFFNKTDLTDKCSIDAQS